ncbi:MAG: TetR/AcrR family transcriptional regulator [Longimicrobiales bacterium]|nr:TetR/AcrR family transcriptional regulator [Longimicrobiales bacterium]
MTRLTARGKRTRERILRAAVRLFSTHGFTDTSVSDILEEAGAGKSQFYHYFDDKADLVRHVLRFQRLRNLPSRKPEHGHLDRWDRIRAWFDQLLEVCAESGAGGLDLIGAFPAALAQDAKVRREIRRTTHLRRRVLHRGLRRMKHRGELVPSADPGRMATFAAAAIEGGLHLSATAGSPDPLQAALEETWSRLRSYAVR